MTLRRWSRAPFAVRFLARALNEAAEDTPLHARLWEIGGASPSATTASITSTFTPGWTHHEFAGTIQASGRTELALIVGAPYGSAVTGAQYGLCCVQTEQGPRSTSYLDGDLGSGFNWLDEPHASPSTRERTVARVRTPEMLHQRGAAVASLRPAWASDTTGRRLVFETDAFALSFEEGAWEVSQGSMTLSAPASHSAEAIVILWVGWAPQEICLAVGEIEERRQAAPHSPLSGQWSLGSGVLVGDELDAILGPVRWLREWPSALQRYLHARMI